MRVQVTKNLLIILLLVMVIVSGCDFSELVDVTLAEDVLKEIIREAENENEPQQGESHVLKIYTPLLSPLLNARGFFGVILLSDGRVWTWGYNKYGQLGSGDRTSRSYATQVLKEPEEVSHTADISLKNIKDIAVGGYAVLALSKKNELYAWGKNYGIMARLLFKPSTSIQSIALGDDFALFLSEDGQVYSWGVNTSGQLGLGDYKRRDIYRMITELRNEKIVAIYAGSSFSLARTEDGRLYGWGYNGRGSLGDGSTVDKSNPVQVMWYGSEGTTENPEPLSGVKALSVGSNFVVALLETGMVVGWGRNDLGQLDTLGTSAFLHPVPLKIDGPIQDLDAGEDYFLIFREDNQVQLWGNGYSQESRWILGIPDPIIDLSTGGFTSLILTDKRELYILSGVFSNIVEKIPLQF